MNIGEYSVNNKVVSWLLILILVCGGVWGFEKLGKLEDPAFTIREAKVITYYPGASAQQVQDEVTYHVEDAIQRLEQVKRIKKSISRPGVSDISIEFRDTYRGPDFPNIYDELRRKVADMAHKPPLGAQAPMVIDDFADVYGIYLALSGEGYSWRDLWDTADNLKKQLVLVPGVRKAAIAGARKEVVYVELSRARLGELRISPDQIAAILKSQNVVADAGSIRVGDAAVRIWPTGESTSVASIGDVLIASANRKLIHLRDIATIHRAYQEIPDNLHYIDRKPALTLGISIQRGENVIAVGEALAERFGTLQASIPIGLQLTPIYNQPGEVESSVNGFLVSVAQAGARQFHGPDPAVLRQLAEQAKGIMRADPEARDIRDDWRQPVKVIRPDFDEQVGRQLGISRSDLANAMRIAAEDVPVGQYRDGIRLLPILVRAPDEERRDAGNLQDVQIWSPVLERAVPVAQVVRGFDTVWENAVVRGRDRIQTIIASTNPSGELATPLFERLRPQVEAIELPPGYSLSWGGEYEDAQNAQGSLFSALPAGFLLMILVSVLLFGKLRQPLIIWLTVPLAIVGITAGLLAAGGAFDFMALLGALSLVGLLIKNAIVLIDEIDQQVAEGKPTDQAILDSGVSRMRPVVLAAATTILGLIPLLSDVFFVNMSIAIMAGLGFATVLTLLVVPTRYAILFRARTPAG